MFLDSLDSVLFLSPPQPPNHLSVLFVLFLISSSALPPSVCSFFLSSLSSLHTVLGPSRNRVPVSPYPALLHLSNTSFFFFFSFPICTLHKLKIWFLYAVSMKFWNLWGKNNNNKSSCVIKTINTVMFISSLCYYRPTSVLHISITWNKWNRACKSHACSSMEMRGQLSLRYQFWTDGLPWGAISPFQLKIRNSDCLKHHAKTHRWVFVCLHVRLSLFFFQTSPSLATSLAVTPGGSQQRGRLLKSIQDVSQ